VLWWVCSFQSERARVQQRMFDYLQIALEGSNATTTADAAEVLVTADAEPRGMMAKAIDVALKNVEVGATCVFVCYALGPGRNLSFPALQTSVGLSCACQLRSRQRQTNTHVRNRAADQHKQTQSCAAASLCSTNRAA